MPVSRLVDVVGDLDPAVGVAHADRVLQTVVPHLQRQARVRDEPDVKERSIKGKCLEDTSISLMSYVVSSFTGNLNVNVYANYLTLLLYSCSSCKRT